MRVLVTLLLALGVAAGTAWLVLGAKARSTLGLAPAAPADADAPAVRALAGLRPDKVQKLDITLPDQPPLSLSKGPDGTWSQPGNWPVREGEVAAPGQRPDRPPHPLPVDPGE